MMRVSLATDGKFYTDEEQMQKSEPYSSNRGIETTADVVSAMSDPRYAKDEEYRQIVHRLMAESQGVINSGDATQGQNTDDLEAAIDIAKQAFGDPRYKTSAAFRREVNLAIAQDTTTQVEPLNKFTRIELPANESGPMAPAAVTPKPRPEDEWE